MWTHLWVILGFALVLALWGVFSGYRGCGGGGSCSEQGCCGCRVDRKDNCVEEDRP